MTSEQFRRLLVLSFALAMCAAFACTSRASEKPKRGDYPHCQEQCVDQLRERMSKISDDYDKTANRLLYQELVEKARLDYDSCIENCKELLPVK
jgi:hypothetical protein